MTSIKTHLSRRRRRIIKLILWGLDHLTDGDRLLRYTYYYNGYHNPNYRIRKDQIAFVHVPKTAGTSLAKLLENDNESRFLNLEIHKPISNSHNPVEFKYITVLRNPIDRVWSYYQMVLRNREGYPYKNYAVRGLDIFLQKCWAARNLSCRYISGDVENEPNEDTLKQSKENLQHFYRILDFENFATEATNFLKNHNISFNEIPNQRKASYPDPNEKETNLIIKYNQMDLALYNYWHEMKTSLK